MDKLQILVAARALISTPETLCRRELARDAQGNPVAPTSSAAVSWCSKGALLKVLAGAPIPDDLEDLLTASNTSADGRPIRAHYAGFTDTQSHDRVMAMWDRSIAEVRA